MEKTNDNDGLEAWRLFARTVSVVVRALEREMAQEPGGLPLTWYEVLARLDHAAEGRLRMQDLAESLFFSRSGVTRILDRMEEGGLVHRLPAADDRRGWYAIITAKGKDVLNRARPGHRQSIERHFLRHLDGAEIKALRAMLAKVHKAEMPRVEMKSAGS